MERYREYKDSGEQWLGEIPSHWKVRKAKFLWTEKDNRSDCGNERLLSVSQYDGVKPTTDESRSESLEGYKIVEQNELVINIMLAWLGGLGVSSYRGIVSPAYCVYKLDDRQNPKYMHYLYKTPMYLAEFARRSTGIVPSRWRMYTDDFGQVLTVVPPLSEQTAMVAYLDRVTAQIDKAIAQQQRMIDLLNERKQIIIQHAVTKGLDPNAEMVDSGVEWIGEMPKGWSVYKLKHICNAFGRIGFRGYSTSDLVEENEGAITLSPSNMKDGGMTYEKCTYLSWKKYEESSEIKIHDGDIIFVKTGSSYGKSSIVYGLPKEATINPQLLVFKDIRCSREFLSYVLMTNSIRNQIETSVIGGTIPTISQNKILNFSFTCPSKGEQENIVCKLGELINPIKSSIKKIEKRISFLRERKQIIINEVVTGKVKVS